MSSRNQDAGKVGAFKGFSTVPFCKTQICYRLTWITPQLHFVENKPYKVQET
jgi:hypothetical protein